LFVFLSVRYKPIPRAPSILGGPGRLRIHLALLAWRKYTVRAVGPVASTDDVQS